VGTESNPEISLAPENALKSIPLKKTEDGKWVHDGTLKTGRFKLHYSSEANKCNATLLKEVACDIPGYHEEDGKCVETQSKVDVCKKTDIKYLGIDAKVLLRDAFPLGAVLNISCNSKLVDTREYKLSLVAQTKSAPFARQTAVDLKQQGLWDLYIQSNTGSETCLALGGIKVTAQCGAQEVLTDDGSCVRARIEASVVTNSANFQIHKPNQHLVGVPPTPDVKIDVTEPGKYQVRIEKCNTRVKHCV
jgi:hypothetical protein